jgi:hypothetical protein
MDEDDVGSVVFVEDGGDVVESIRGDIYTIFQTYFVVRLQNDIKVKKEQNKKKRSSISETIYKQYEECLCMCVLMRK